MSNDAGPQLTGTDYQCPPIRAVLIEGHEVARRGLQDMLGSLSFVELVASVSSPQEAVAILAGQGADLVMFPSDVEERAIQSLIPLRNGARLLILVRTNSHQQQPTLFGFQVDGFIMEASLTTDSLEKTLCHVMRGEFVPLPIELARHLFSRQRRQSLLTRREEQILDLLGEGLSNKEIARRLGISTYGVKRHVASIFLKLGCSNRTAAVVTAIEMCLLERISVANQNHLHSNDGVRDPIRT